MGIPEDQRSGRSWDDIHWYIRDEENENGGYKEIPEVMPDLSRLLASLRNELPDYLRNED
ncbi:hypothetical protein [Streptomyces sp. NPDC056399]|uniref:hypothetical protein n=1 Tax=Streptomyces sp. NPDC056399 TaxID=3345807 RepID=UPI0035DC2395